VLAEALCEVPVGAADPAGSGPQPQHTPSSGGLPSWEWAGWGDLG